MGVVMTDSIRDAIIALQNGESSTFKSIVQDSLMSKAMDAIQIQKISAGQALFDDKEIENNDEERY
jgi:hypothetical protein